MLDSSSLHISSETYIWAIGPVNAPSFVFANSYGTEHMFTISIFNKQNRFLIPPNWQKRKFLIKQTKYLHLTIKFNICTRIYFGTHWIPSSKLWESYHWSKRPLRYQSIYCGHKSSNLVFVTKNLFECFD